MKLKQLDHEEILSIQGGGSNVTFTDSEGYRWSYYYNDAGELTHWCVVRIGVLM